MNTIAALESRAARLSESFRVLNDTRLRLPPTLFVAGRWGYAALPEPLEAELGRLADELTAAHRILGWMRAQAVLEAKKPCAPTPSA